MDSTKAETPRVLVCQTGARRRYAVPRMFEEAGMLAAIYTDSSAHSLLGGCAQMLGPKAPASIRRLVRRQITGVPPEKIFSSDCLQTIELKRRLRLIRGDGTALYRQRHERLSRRMIQWGLQDAGIVYTMYHENLEFVHWAKSLGARSVVDVFISPATYRIMADESTAFPFWGEYKSRENIELAMKLWRETAETADLLLCPSEWVADGVREATPEAANKVRVVPYGCSINYHGRSNRPMKGRVLFAGGSPLRKGLHYLGQAATRLKPIIPDLNVRIAGNLPRQVVEHPVCKDLHFLGKLTSDQMKEEYLSADLFVLPSLSEGFAGVVAEAVGAGCPVVVTREAGSPVVHEREGLVVPSRDADALAQAIQCIVQDRNLRDTLASECRRQADFYSEQAWLQRLVRTVEQLQQSFPSPECDQ